MDFPRYIDSEEQLNELIRRRVEGDLIDRDLQMTLRFEDGTEQTFTVIRDREMRWTGRGTEAPIVRIEAAWFDNPRVISEEAA